MSHIDSFPEGAPCWYELGTTDQAAAKTFYSALFGWSAADAPMDGGSMYTTFQLDDRRVAAAYTLMAEQLAQNVPPHWMVYFRVSDADASAAKTASLGGKVIVPPFDIFDYGRMYVAQDTSGAHYCVWQPKTHPGVGILHQANAFCWAELATREPDKARDYYAELFGWHTKPHAMPGYTIWGVEGKDWGGILPMEGEQWNGIPSHWAIYWTVADCDASTAKATELGGRLNVPPFEVTGVGKISGIADPQGASCYLIQPMAM